jgi:hypothetical protein
MIVTEEMLGVSKRLTLLILLYDGINIEQA